MRCKMHFIAGAAALAAAALAAAAATNCSSVLVMKTL